MTCDLDWRGKTKKVNGISPRWMHGNFSVASSNLGSKEGCPNVFCSECFSLNWVGNKNSSWFPIWSVFAGTAFSQFTPRSCFQQFHEVLFFFIFSTWQLEFDISCYDRWFLKNIDRRDLPVVFPLRAATRPSKMETDRSWRLQRWLLYSPIYLKCVVVRRTDLGRLSTVDARTGGKDRSREDTTNHRFSKLYTCCTEYINIIGWQCIIFGPDRWRNVTGGRRSCESERVR